MGLRLGKGFIWLAAVPDLIQYLTSACFEHFVGQVGGTGLGLVQVTGLGAPDVGLALDIAHIVLRVVGEFFALISEEEGARTGLGVSGIDDNSTKCCGTM